MLYLNFYRCLDSDCDAVVWYHWHCHCRSSLHLLVAQWLIGYVRLPYHQSIALSGIRVFDDIRTKIIDFLFSLNIRNRKKLTFILSRLNAFTADACSNLSALYWTILPLPARTTGCTHKIIHF